MGVHYDRGTVLFRHKRHDLALKEFEQELVRDPNCPASWSMICLCQNHLSRPKSAREAAENAIAANPNYAWGHYSLAWAFYSDYAFASRRPSDALSGLTTADLARARLRFALTAAEEAMRISPREVAFHIIKGTILLDQWRLREALATADEGLALDPTAAGCLRLRATVLRHFGDHAAAQSAAGLALEAEPENTSSHLVAGWNALAAERYGKAREYFAESLRLDPSYAQARSGMLQAMRARFWFYRPMVWLAVRQSRSPRFKVQVRIGATILGLFLSGVSGGFDALVDDQSTRGWNVEMAETGLFAGMVLLISPALAPVVLRSLADYFLLFDPMGRGLLSRKEQIGAIAIPALSLAACLCAGIRLWEGRVNGEMLFLAGVSVAGLTATLMDAAVRFKAFLSRRWRGTMPMAHDDSRLSP